jgi:hypothetical protein
MQADVIGQMKKRFNFDGFTQDGSFGSQASSGSLTDAGDSFPRAALAHASTSGAASVSNATTVASVPTLADWLVNGFWQYEGTNAHHWASSTISYNINGLKLRRAIPGAIGVRGLARSCQRHLRADDGKREYHVRRQRQHDGCHQCELDRFRPHDVGHRRYPFQLDHQ